MGGCAAQRHAGPPVAPKPRESQNLPGCLGPAHFPRRSGVRGESPGTTRATSTRCSGISEEASPPGTTQLHQLGVAPFSPTAPGGCREKEAFRFSPSEGEGGRRWGAGDEGGQRAMQAACRHRDRGASRWRATGGGRPLGTLPASEPTPGSQAGPRRVRTSPGQPASPPYLGLQ